MGVQGLWRLLDTTGNQIAIDRLQDKTLAVDVSLWLHHSIKGFQDSRGASVPNAHLLSLYHRICKLLYFRIQPIFVFDGGVPVLKKETILKRNQSRSKHLTDAERVHRQLLDTLVKQTAVNTVLSEKTKATITTTSPIKSRSFENDDDDLFKLPELNFSSSAWSANTTTSSDGDDIENSSDESEEAQHPKWDLHSIDTKSCEFKSLPLEIRHEILTELKETRKQNSWGRISELPSHSGDFATFQMNRLLNRQSVQKALEDVEKEMGGHCMSLVELESLLQDKGVITKEHIGSRLASDENTKYVLVKDLKKALENVIKDTTNTNVQDVMSILSEENNSEDNELQVAIQLSLEQDSHIKPLDNKKILVEKKGLILSKDMEDLLATNEDNMNTLSNGQPFCDEIASTSNAIIKTNSQKTHQYITGTENIACFQKSDNCLNIKEPCDEYHLENKQSVHHENNILTEPKKVSDADIKQNISEKYTEDNNDSDVSNSSNKVEEGSKNASFVTISESDESDNDFIEVNSPIKNDHEEKNAHLTLSVNVDDYQEQNDIFADIFAHKEENLNISQNTNTGETTIYEIQEQSEPTNISNDLAATNVEEVVSDDNNESSSQFINIFGRENRDEVSMEKLNEIKQKLINEKEGLIYEQHSKERMGSNITDQMCQDAQELLQLFGIPYIVAPMEAEAQCAFLEQIQLTNGTITDDSDIWLFGGETVYRNFFNPNKVVTEFTAESIKEHLSLTREQMVLLALLVGSDYTLGLKGIGPVTALEILATFPSNTDITSGLTNFKLWLQDKASGQYKGLSKKLKSVSISNSFPNEQIIEAYLNPVVNTSSEKFSWAPLNLNRLVEFGRIKFGWTQKKTEETLTPIVKKLSEIKKQSRIDNYFHKNAETSQQVDPTLKFSKRVHKVIQKFKSNSEDGLNGENLNTRNFDDADLIYNVDFIPSDEDISVLKETIKASKKRIDTNSNKVRKPVSTKINRKRKQVKLDVHAKEIIPQREVAKETILKNRLKAIETFRKSRKGPGYVPKTKRRKQTQNEANLSESSD